MEVDAVVAILEIRMNDATASDLFFGLPNPFGVYCGIEAVDVVGGRTRLRLDLQQDHTNHLGFAHGGIICTLLDIAMGTAARLKSRHQVMTLDMQARFLTPGRGILLAEGFVVHAGGSILFCEATVTTEAGSVIATSTGVFKIARQS